MEIVIPCFDLPNRSGNLQFSAFRPIFNHHPKQSNLCWVFPTLFLFIRKTLNQLDFLIFPESFGLTLHWHL